MNLLIGLLILALTLLLVNTVGYLANRWEYGKNSINTAFYRRKELWSEHRYHYTVYNNMMRGFFTLWIIGMCCACAVVVLVILNYVGGEIFNLWRSVL